MTITYHTLLAVCALVSFLAAGLNVTARGKFDFTALGFFFAFAWVVVR